MATWQFKLELIPRPWASETNDVAHRGIDSITTAWAKHRPSAEVTSLAATVLPEGKSWHPNLRVWGCDERSDIHAWYEEDKLESVSMRLDLREDFAVLLGKVVDLAIELDCVFLVSESKTLVEPDVLSLKRAIKESDAAKFVKNPKEFLKNR